MRLLGRHRDAHDAHAGGGAGGGGRGGGHAPHDRRHARLDLRLATHLRPRQRGEGQRVHTDVRNETRQKRKKTRRGDRDDRNRTQRQRQKKTRSAEKGGNPREARAAKMGEPARQGGSVARRLRLRRGWFERTPTYRAVEVRDVVALLRRGRPQRLPSVDANSVRAHELRRVGPGVGAVVVVLHLHVQPAQPVRPIHLRPEVVPPREQRVAVLVPRLRSRQKKRVTNVTNV
eukprot:1814273-Pyramimonas_sp.AAC.1